jgi:hypothetical protein
VRAFTTRSWSPIAEKEATLEGNYEDQPFYWTARKPGVFRTYAAPLILVGGALLAIGLFLFA